MAARRLFLGPDGRLNPDASVLAADLKRFCKVGGAGVAYSPVSGSVDPVATVAMAARREVWDRILNLLNLEPHEVVNLRDNENG